MEWAKVWYTVFCGWDGDIDVAALADELRGGSGTGTARLGEERDAAAWLRRQIQEAY